MDWYFDFITVVVEDQDSLDKALIEAVAKLPLGGHEANHRGIEWELVSITPKSWEIWKNLYTNDKEGD